MDLIIQTITSANPLVTTANGIREPGMYHRLIQPEFNILTSLLQVIFLRWGTDCTLNNLSMGRIYYVTGHGRGKLTMTNHIIPPFND